MAGIAAAFHLTVRQGHRDVVLVDERPPLTLTSDKGTEAYRNWWTGPDDTMVQFMNRSIDLLEELGHETANAFQMNRRGYVFLTCDPGQVPGMRQTAAEISALGAGPVRVHPGPSPYVPAPAEGFQNLPDGADLILDRDLIRQQFPFLTEDVVGLTHVRRCGWLDAQKLGRWLLNQAQSRGACLLRDRVEAVSVAHNRIQMVHLRSGDRISTRTLVIAAGPYLRQVGAMLGLDIPVFNELHGKMAFKDHLGIVPPETPLMFWNDPIYLPWTETERARWAESEGTRRLLDEFPPGVHFRPKGGASHPLLLIIWTYDARATEPVWPPTFDPDYPRVLLRGLARVIPGLSAYFGQESKGYVDGGYYCKTRENRPLIGPLPVQGAYVVGALSGYGIMGSQAAGNCWPLTSVAANCPTTHQRSGWIATKTRPTGPF